LSEADGAHLVHVDEMPVGKISAQHEISHELSLHSKARVQRRRPWELGGIFCSLPKPFW
jgi:hypothetical protein